MEKKIKLCDKSDRTWYHLSYLSTRKKKNQDLYFTVCCEMTDRMSIYIDLQFLPNVRGGSRALSAPPGGGDWWPMKPEGFAEERNAERGWVGEGYPLPPVGVSPGKFLGEMHQNRAFWDKSGIFRSRDFMSKIFNVYTYIHVLEEIDWLDEFIVPKRNGKTNSCSFHVKTLQCVYLYIRIKWRTWWV